MSILRRAGTIGAGVAMLAASGCQSLDVTNPNEPDTKRTLGDAGGVLAVAGGTYRSWFNTNQSMEGAGALITMADNYTASWNNFNMRLYSSEPRAAWANDPGASARTTIEWYWYGYYSGLSSANDVVKAIRVDSIDVNGAAQTKMVEAAAVLMQGMTLGDLALIYDQAFIVSDTTTDLLALTFSTREEVRDYALEKLEEAIALAGTVTVSTPSNWTNGFTYSPTQLKKLANTMAARLLAYYPRSLAENAAVDWDRVAAFASQGISSGSGFDFMFQGDGGCPDITGTDSRGVCDEIKLWSNDPTTMRMDTRVANMLDPATQSDPWPDPQGNPPPNSPDKRLGDGSFGDSAFAADITEGRKATANAGTDFAWSGSNPFRPARGQYHQSNIAAVRYIEASFSDPAGSGGGFAAVPAVTATENDLLWAEGLIRGGGDLALAAQKINNTRVNRGGLSAAAAGNADLLAKLQYEQDVELHGLGAVTFFNRRRIDGLLPLTPRHMPVPAKELGVLQLELYTFGGPGNPEFSRTAGTRNVREVQRALEKESASNRRRR